MLLQCAADIFLFDCCDVVLDCSIAFWISSAGVVFRSIFIVRQQVIHMFPSGLCVAV